MQARTKDYLLSYGLRIFINITFIIILKYYMIDTLNILPKFVTDISKFSSNSSAIGESYNVSNYIFSETSILVTASGLFIVALMSMLFAVRSFRIMPKESNYLFKIRLMLYTISSLLLNNIITLYLFVLVALMTYPGSLRMNNTNMFIWEYVTYAIIFFIYSSELYNFMTNNNEQNL
jgi:hypothetical protein